MNIIGLDHIAIVVSDMEASVEWYGKHFGMKVLERAQLKDGDIKIAYIGAHGLMLEVFEVADTQAATEAGLDPFEALERRGIRHFAIAVKDVEAAQAYFEAQDIEVIMNARASPSIPTRICFIRDPDDIQIELVVSVVRVFGSAVCMI